MNYDELKWINQSLYTYKDRVYESHGYMDISVSMNTSDDINFSQPKLAINLDNQGQKRSVRLAYSNVVDLIDSFNKVIKNLQQVYSDPDHGDITKRYNQDKDLVFEFRAVPNSGEMVVVILINHNTSDQGKIIIPLAPDFVTIGKILRMFETNYIKLCTDLPNRYLSSISVNKLISIQNAIKILPTQLIPLNQSNELIISNGIEEFIGTGTRCSICGEDQFETDSGVTCINGHGGADGIDDSKQANEFEKFTLENEDKVRIPELESDIIIPKAPISQEYNSPFITNVLKNNIHNLEDMLYALFTNNNPLMTIMNSIHQGQGYTLLPGISEDDLKSVLYVSNMFFKLNFQSYIQNQTGFPIAVPVVKYKTNEEIDRPTIELSYDLMMIQAYLKLYRNRMEAINSDPYTNGALVHFSFRCFLDVATFSYLNGTNSEAIKNTVISRFRYFREIGFFDFYDRNLISQNQKTIYENEIGEYVDKVFDNVVESDDINVRHFNGHDNSSVKLPPKNKFTIEQITNEIVKYEIKTMFGQRIEDLTSNSDMILLFNTKIKKKHKPTDHQPEPRKVETNVVRYIKLKANEISESIRGEFIEYIESLGDNTPYDYFNNIYKLEELPEIIIQTLYTWNENINEPMKYTGFVLRVEDCIDKDLIISKIKELDKIVNDTDAEVGGDWSNTMDGIEF